MPLCEKLLSSWRLSGPLVASVTLALPRGAAYKRFFIFYLLVFGMAYLYLALLALFYGIGNRPFDYSVFLGKQSVSASGLS
ncbi:MULTISPECIES: hypothetical protein [Pantoea]|uniref:hypothetical protein n=1 Tax=Pantoea TaxID=53335 RepID=UPI0011CFA1DA|nr:MULTISPECIES: hypothetical protein [Pantoea]